MFNVNRKTIKMLLNRTSKIENVQPEFFLFVWKNSNLYFAVSAFYFLSFAAIHKFYFYNENIIFSHKMSIFKTSIFSILIYWRVRTPAVSVCVVNFYYFSHYYRKYIHCHVLATKLRQSENAIKIFFGSQYFSRDSIAFGYANVWIIWNALKANNI